jgi:hypothetical protein
MSVFDSTIRSTAVQFGRIPLHPAPDRDVIDGEIPLRHHFFEISEAKSKPVLPADTPE